MEAAGWGVLWELTHNPLVVLQTVSHDRIREVLDDPLIHAIISELIDVKKQHQVSPLWFQKAYPDSYLKCVAYFSMEFMLSEALPIYSGGLGNVAGDHLKTASDLGVPIVGVGLLYQQGYTRQIINTDGTQQYVGPFNDPGQLPITPIRQPNGERLRIEVKLPGYSVWLLTWQVQVGRVTLLLLDSNDAANFPLHRGITSKLYGGGAWLRLMQELVLGIGGWRLLKKLGYEPQVCHLNEGHTAFAVVERAFDYMQANNTNFDVALSATRSGNVYTTHTAIGGGFDRFDGAMIEQYLGTYIKENLRITTPHFLALGRINKDDKTEPFNTGFLAVNGSGFINGVSRLHGHVSRQLYAPLYPRWPIAEVPVNHITNGVHMSTWDSPEADRLWTEVCGKDRWMGTLEKMEVNMHAINDERLWALRRAGEEVFINFVRKRYARQLATLGLPAYEIEKAETIFDPAVLTMAFARRMASYKRPELLMKNAERLKRIFFNAEKPVQLILAGKAHEGDKKGQAIIQHWLQFIHQHGLQDKIIFLSDYDMVLTGHLVQGADLWINTSQRPWEACGTSGMKVLVNGGLNVSTLDGWWDEAYNPDLGWAITSNRNENNDEDIDDSEADALYNLLEYDIIPAFYNRNEKGIPQAWVSRMRESMARLTSTFSSNRSLRQYTESYYLPAAAAYARRAADGSAFTKQLVAWQRHLQQHWHTLSFGSLTIKENEDYYQFYVQVYLGLLQPADVRVQLFADGIDGNEMEIHEMKPCTAVFSNEAITVYGVKIKKCRIGAHYTPRVVPDSWYTSVPLECNLIAWYR